LSINYDLAKNYTISLNCRDTVGVKILLRLGWRHGKGLGPSKSRKHKIRKDTKTTEASQGNSSETTGEKIYTCMMPENFQPRRGDSESESDEDLDHIVLPDDNEDVLCNPKENLFGLGYSGLDRNTLSFGNNNLLDSLKFRVQNKNLSIRGEVIPDQPFHIIGSALLFSELQFLVDNIFRLSALALLKMKMKKCIHGWMPRSTILL
jgi:hypothetical protein